MINLRTQAFIYCLMLWVCLALPAFSASEGEIEVDSHVDKSEISIGDKILYTIEVTYPTTGVLQLPSILGNLGSFEVKDFQESDPEVADGKRVKKWNITLSTFTTGEYTIPPQLLEYIPENDTAKLTTYTEPVVIQVNRTTAETVKDIADITGLARMPGNNPIKPWMVILLVVMLLGLFAWVRFLKKKKKAEPPPVPPYEAALEALSKLAARELVAKNRSKEFCFLLSEILRKFLKGRYGLDALESTTEEFLAMLPKSPLNQNDRDKVVHFCHQTDPVKFANLSLSPDEGKILLDSIRSLVKNHKPTAEQEKPGVKA